MQGPQAPPPPRTFRRYFRAPASPRAARGPPERTPAPAPVCRQQIRSCGAYRLRTVRQMRQTRCSHRQNGARQQAWRQCERKKVRHSRCGTRGGRSLPVISADSAAYRSDISRSFLRGSPLRYFSALSEVILYSFPCGTMTLIRSAQRIYIGPLF